MLIISEKRLIIFKVKENYETLYWSSVNKVMMVRFNKKENGERKELLSSMNQIETDSTNPNPKHNDNGKSF